jgi:rubrerythrin
LRAVADMPKKFNENLLKAIEATQEAVGICRQAMIDANDESCRAMYSAILKDCEKHLEMFKEEIELHKKQKKWDT